MAQGRFLSRTVATSRQLDRLSWRAELLFYRCIPHLDRDGRIDGEPGNLKVLVAPRNDKLPAAAFPKLLQELHDANLVVWYQVDGVSALWFPKFLDHQKGMKYDRESPSRLPDPPEESGVTPYQLRTQVRSNSGSTPDSGPESLRSRSGVTPAEVKFKSKSKSKAGPPESVRSNWVAAIHAELIQVGDCKHGQVGKLLRTLHQAHGALLVAAAAAYRRKMLAAGPEQSRYIRGSVVGDFAKQAGVFVEEVRPGSGVDANGDPRL